MAPMDAEAALLDFVDRLRKFTRARRAVHVRLSQLRPYNRRDHHLRIAAATFERLIHDFDGALFRLFNEDLLVIFNGASMADIDHAILHLRYLFSEDPFLKHDEDGDTRFCVWFDLEEDYLDLVNLAQRMVSLRVQHDRDEKQSPLKIQEEKATPAEAETDAI